jgi:2-keto-4-pentenoate hydratase/2-oxohepta-3-ene-1,7-dioic acid hydratase in catechol pathway
VKIVSFYRGAIEAPHTGCLLSETELLDFSHPACDLPQPAELLGWFDTETESHKAARALADEVCADESRQASLREAGAISTREECCVTAPIPRPGKIICIGLNYRDHAEESGMDVPKSPVTFSKFANSVVGPNAEVVIPPGSVESDYEAEFGIVIGKTATRVSEADAMEHVLGYVCINDVSARDFQFADGQWQRGKSPDTFCPMGEAVVTRDEIADPHNLRVQLRLNGETMQDSNTKQLVFGVEALVSFLSQWTTLEPGDVIPTGTPPGVGFARKPPVYIQPGDVMEVDIEGLGILRNPVVACES